MQYNMEKLKKHFFRAAAMTSAVVLCVACGPTYDVAQPLDSWTSSTNGQVNGTEISVAGGETLKAQGDYKNFCLTGEALADNGAEAGLMFHSDGTSGYEVLFHNGPIDGSRKTGSLSSVRNLYRSLADDGHLGGPYGL